MIVQDINFVVGKEKNNAATKKSDHSAGQRACKDKDAEKSGSIKRVTTNGGSTRATDDQLRLDG